jgi:hypothetical protein
MRPSRERPSLEQPGMTKSLECDHA